MMMICTETNMKIRFRFISVAAAACGRYILSVEEKNIHKLAERILNAIIFNDLCRHRNGL